VEKAAAAGSLRAARWRDKNARSGLPLLARVERVGVRLEISMAKACKSLMFTIILVNFNSFWRHHGKPGLVGFYVLSSRGTPLADQTLIRVNPI